EGPGDGDAGEAEGARGPVHREDVRVVLLVSRDDQADHLDLVPESVGKQGPDRPVDETRRERLLLDGSALALEIAAGDSPAGVRALTILYGKPEEVLPPLRAPRRH